MSIECDIAEKVVKKKLLREQLDELNRDIKIKCRQAELPFAVEYDGYAVTVQKTSYPDQMPPSVVVKLVEHCPLDVVA